LTSDRPTVMSFIRVCLNNFTRKVCKEKLVNKPVNTKSNPITARIIIVLNREKIGSEIQRMFKKNISPIAINTKLENRYSF